jgi:CelD/BcsL family acetyltransferase involved in cellulose biosynthesis
MIALLDEEKAWQYEARWLKLCRPDLGPFVTPSWAKLWRRHFGAASRLVVLAADDGSTDNGEPWALWPLESDPEGVLWHVGGREVTDYAAPLFDGDAESFASEVAEYLSENRSVWKQLRIEALPGDIGFHGPFAESLAARGAKVELVFDEVCPVLDLPASFDEYLGRLHKKHRHEVRRKQRRLRSELGPPTLRVSRPETLESDIALFFSWHRNSKGSKGGFLDAGYESFFRDVLRTSSREGWLRLSFLQVDGIPYSAIFAFEWQGRLFIYNSAHEPTARHLSPGIVHLVEEIRSGIERGLSALDFLQGDERYKFELGARPRQLVTVYASFD